MTTTEQRRARRWQRTAKRDYVWMVAYIALNDGDLQDCTVADAAQMFTVDVVAEVFGLSRTTVARDVKRYIKDGRF